ncbi:hypothetical protein HKBW3S33_01684 [Candidatus Hakubella thermalkaliphila]|uniref:Uncharacterized protein n=1 Tax=Candidatus Hakubella thermalkaliphila TaxID=2754717 RepID=A0A6V8P6N5_9ACTN|nr:hypothetical protein HKBW3S33_01684 [Candidatus Hakubella thermalkaliphila]
MEKPLLLPKGIDFLFHFCRFILVRQFGHQNFPSPPYAVLSASHIRINFPAENSPSVREGVRGGFA